MSTRVVPQTRSQEQAGAPGQSRLIRIGRNCDASSRRMVRKTSGTTNQCLPASSQPRLTGTITVPEYRSPGSRFATCSLRTRLQGVSRWTNEEVGNRACGGFAKGAIYCGILLESPQYSQTGPITEPTGVYSYTEVKSSFGPPQILEAIFVKGRPAQRRV